MSVVLVSLICGLSTSDRAYAQARLRFDTARARAAGYSDAEIRAYLDTADHRPKTRTMGEIADSVRLATGGFSAEEIRDYLAALRPKKATSWDSLTRRGFSTDEATQLVDSIYHLAPTGIDIAFDVALEFRKLKQMFEDSLSLTSSRSERKRVRSWYLASVEAAARRWQSYRSAPADSIPQYLQQSEKEAQELVRESEQEDLRELAGKLLWLLPVGAGIGMIIFGARSTRLRSWTGTLHWGQLSILSGALAFIGFVPFVIGAFFTEVFEGSGVPDWLLGFVPLGPLTVLIVWWWWFGARPKRTTS